LDIIFAPNNHWYPDLTVWIHVYIYYLLMGVML